jgi:hypothetical protein
MQLFKKFAFTEIARKNNGVCFRSMKIFIRCQEIETVQKGSLGGGMKGFQPCTHIWIMHDKIVVTAQEQLFCLQQLIIAILYAINVRDQANDVYCSLSS